MRLPQAIKLAAVPNFLMDRYGLEVTRQTIYNWANKGLRDEKLQTMLIQGKPTAKHPKIRVTTAAWITAFLLRCGVEIRPIDDPPAGGQADATPTSG